VIQLVHDICVESTLLFTRRYASYFLTHIITISVSGVCNTAFTWADNASEHFYIYLLHSQSR